jgi:hypothetical protein
MCDHRRPLRIRLRWSVPVLAGFLTALAPAAAAPPTAADRALLADADLGRALPAAFRSEVRVEPLAGGGAMRFEIWRAGDRALVRFLDSRQRGKAFLQRADGTWLLAPHAHPVRLGTASRVAAGVSLQELVGLAVSRDFTIEDVKREQAGAADLVTFVLRAKAAGTPYPLLHYVVRSDTRRPVRIEFRLSSGKLARLVEVRAWRPGSRLVPAETIAKDLVGGRAPVRVRLLAVEERQPPPHLFELSAAGEAARAALATG